MEDRQIEDEFLDIVENMTDDQFWKYTRSWFDEQGILDIMKEWDIDTKKEAIKEMKKIMRKKCQMKEKH